MRSGARVALRLFGVLVSKRDDAGHLPWARGTQPVHAEGRRLRRGRAHPDRLRRLDGRSRDQHPLMIVLDPPLKAVGRRGCYRAEPGGRTVFSLDREAFRRA
jgi:hypothetical protein